MVKFIENFIAKFLLSARSFSRVVPYQRTDKIAPKKNASKCKD